MVPQEQNLQKICKMVPRELPPFRLMCHNEGHMLNAYHRSPNRPMPGGWIVVRSGPSASGACGKRASVLECGGPPPLWPAPNCKRTLRKPWGSFIFHSPFFILHLKIRGLKVIQGYSRLNFFSPAPRSPWDAINQQRSPYVPCGGSRRVKTRTGTARERAHLNTVLTFCGRSLAPWLQPGEKSAKWEKQPFLTAFLSTLAGTVSRCAPRELAAGDGRTASCAVATRFKLDASSWEQYDGAVIMTFFVHFMHGDITHCGLSMAAKWFVPLCLQPRRGLFVEKASDSDFPFPSTGRGIKGEGWLYPAHSYRAKASSINDVAMFKRRVSSATGS